MSLNTFEPSPPFVDSAAGKNTFVAAADLNRLRQNALFLNMLTLKGHSAWTDTLFPSENYGGSPFLITNCSFQYRTGMTTASFVIYSVIPGGTHTARVRFNGTQVATAALTGGVGGGTQNINVTISGMSFTDYQIVDVEIDVAVTGSSTPATYRVFDAYVAPLASVYAPSYGGVPTFGTVNANNLNQLANAQQWLMERLLIAQQPGLMTDMIFSLHGYVSTKIAWSGSLTRQNGATRLYVAVGLEVVTNAAEFLRLHVFGSMNATFDSPIFSAYPGQQLYLFDIDVSSQPTNTAFAVALVQHVTTANATSQQGTRITIYQVEVRHASPPAITVPAISSPRESLTYSALQTRLNQIATITNTAAGRISSEFDLFNRQRMFRWSPGLDAGQRTTFKDVLITRVHRTTDAIWVRGKNVKAGWGNRRINRVWNDPWTQEFQYTADVISGDSVQDKLIYLDTLEGLFPGVDLWIFGDDVRYVAESWG